METNKRSQTQISPYLNPQYLELATPRLAYVICWYARLGPMRGYLRRRLWRSSQPKDS